MLAIEVKSFLDQCVAGKTRVVFTAEISHIRFPPATYMEHDEKFVTFSCDGILKVSIDAIEKIERA